MSDNYQDEYSAEQQTEQEATNELPKNKSHIGVIFMLLHVLFLSLTYLFSRILYFRHPTLDPELLLGTRCTVATAMLIFWHNFRLKYIMIDSVPRHMYKNLFLRCAQSCFLNIFEFTVVKYVSLIFQGIALNLSPITTIILSFFMTGEAIKASEIVFIFVSFVAATLITYGNYQKQMMNKSDKDLDDKNDDFQTQYVTIYIPILALIIVPFLTSLGTVLSRLLQGLDINTPSCYSQPMMAIIPLMLAFSAGSSSQNNPADQTSTLQVLYDFNAYDWTLLVASSIMGISFQIFRFVALRYEEPGKLSQYIYLMSVYALCFDVFIFNEEFLQIQWIGFIILFFGYSYKFWMVYKKAGGESSSQMEDNDGDEYKREEMMS